MKQLPEMKQWLTDLEALALEHEVQSDTAIVKKLSQISIHLDALEVDLPGLTEHLRDALLELQTDRIATLAVATLQDIVGYYAIPDQPLGQNEPIIGSAMAHQLKQQLSVNDTDVFALKDQITELLINHDQR